MPLAVDLERVLDLAALLREKRISHVYVVGLAGDYCVKATAMDARKEGFKTCVIGEGGEECGSE